MILILIKHGKYVLLRSLEISFFNVDIPLTIQDPIFKYYICIKNMTDEGTVSQIVDIGPG